MSTPLPYITRNGAEAFALSVAGFTPLYVANEYTPDHLAKLGCTALEAWQRGIPGMVGFMFDRTPALVAASAAYLDEIDRIKSKRPGSTIPTEPEDVVRIAAVILAQRKNFADIWKRISPSVSVAHSRDQLPADSSSGGTVKKYFPGFTSVTIGADPRFVAKLDRIS
jgi:hypothetical protein